MMETNCKEEILHVDCSQSIICCNKNEKLEIEKKM
jgi:hypothetical protein